MRKILFLIIGFCLLAITVVPITRADTATDNALNFLRAKQDAAGRINTGFSAPSQWSAIAFAVNNIDVATVKASDKSLLDFLLTDIPTSGSAATDWESKILAIVAIGQDPTNFGGTNFVTNLETFYNNGQIGDTCSLNDDIFGLLALIASGSTSSTQIKQDTLNFLISKQDTTDGGFGFSAPGCAWYATSSDMTGAALQALVLAKNKGLTNTDLDTSIVKAKNYLLTNQYSDGGFGYYGSSDPDSTSWDLQALNILGMQGSTQAQAARTYLLSQQSSANGGITAYDWGTSTFVANATTTAQAVIALSGKSWVNIIFSPAITPTPTVSLTPTVTPAITPTVTTTPTSTPTPTPTTNPSSASPTSTPTPTATPTVAPTSTPAVLSYTSVSPTESEPTPEVLGAKIKALKPEVENKGTSKFLAAGIFTGLGMLFIFIYLAKPYIIKWIKK